MSKNKKKRDIGEQEIVADPCKILILCSSKIFKLDEVSRAILAFIGANGPQTQSSLARHVGRIQSRNPILTRIESKGGLLENDFLYEAPGNKHKTGTVERLFGLTFKGFVASLSSIKFEETKLMQYYLKDLLETSKNQSIANLAFEYIRHNLALILLWHQVNGLDLTSQKNSDQYFSIFNNTYQYDKLPFVLDQIKDILPINEYSQLRAQFLALQIALAKILQNREKNYSLESYTTLIFDKKISRYKSKTLLYDMIANWIISLRYVGYYHTKKVPKVIGLHKGNIIHVKNMDKLSNQILNKFNFTIEGKSIVII